MQCNIRGACTALLSHVSWRTGVSTSIPVHLDVEPFFSLHGSREQLRSNIHAQTSDDERQLVDEDVFRSGDHKGAVQEEQIFLPIVPLNEVRVQAYARFRFLLRLRMVSFESVARAPVRVIDVVGRIQVYCLACPTRVQMQTSMAIERQRRVAGAYELW